MTSENWRRTSVNRKKPTRSDPIIYLTEDFFRGDSRHRTHCKSMSVSESPLNRRLHMSLTAAILVFLALRGEPDGIAAPPSPVQRTNEAVRTLGRMPLTIRLESKVPTVGSGVTAASAASSGGGQGGTARSGGGAASNGGTTAPAVSGGTTGADVPNAPPGDGT